MSYTCTQKQERYLNSSYFCSMEGVIKIESEKGYTLELTGAEIVLIAQLLENQPYKSVSMTIN